MSLEHQPFSKEEDNRKTTADVPPLDNAVGYSIESTEPMPDIDTYQETPYDPSDIARIIASDPIEFHQAAESVRELQQTHEQKMSLGKKVSLGALGLGGVATTLGLALAATGFFGGAKQGDQDRNTPPAPEPTVEAPVTPGQTITPTEAPAVITSPSPSDIPTSSFEPTPSEVNTLDTFTPFEPGVEQELNPSDLEIKSGLKGDELAQAIVNRFNAWNMAGAIEQTFTGRDRSIDVEEYAAIIADDNAKVFALSLFADPSDPETIEAINHTRDANAGALNAYIRTFDSSLNPENSEPYWTQSELDGEAQYSRHQNIIQIIIPKIAYDNSDKNTVEESKMTTGYKAVTILKLVDDGKTLKIESISNNPR